MFLFFGIAQAHKVNLFISNKNATLDIYSYFANGKACKNCRLIIKNEDKIVLEDKLDDNGEYLYKAKQKVLEVIIDAGEGHIVKEILQLENIKNEDIKTHKEKEQKLEYLKILLGLALIFFIFFILKKVKR